jgi:two-component system chemotaxis sensor kinase CheA
VFFDNFEFDIFDFDIKGASMPNDKPTRYLGKYREIVLAVVCFLIFDITVLSLNFYISFQLSDSAAAINLAGRQRMLSQRMTKELLAAKLESQELYAMQNAPSLKALQKTVTEFNATINNRVGSERVQSQRMLAHRMMAELGSQPVTVIQPSTSLQALQKTITQFNATLEGFESGGLVTGGDGRQVHLNAIQSKTGRDILQQTDAIWLPLYEKLSHLSPDGSSVQELSEATAYAGAHNLELLGLMNKLTSEMEQSANARANFLRWVQTAGIILALLNFGYILGKGLNRLRASDRETEQAQRETAEILSTVKEGLFLLDHDFLIGSQYSASLAPMLGQPISAGGNFQTILRDLVAPDVYKSACEYIKLLLGDRVKESLVQDLNPLHQIEVNIPSLHGKTQRRYLTLQFNRVLQDGRVSHLLVTAFDVTAQVELGHALIEAQKKAKAEVEVMLDVLKVHPATLKNYLDNAEIALLKINDQLRDVVSGNDYRRTFAHIFREVHRLKGEAALLGLDVFEETAEQFEFLLSGLRNKGAVSGHDLLTLPLPLDEFLKRITGVREITQRLASYQTTFQSEADEIDLKTSLNALAQRIALDQGKHVNLTTELSKMVDLPHHVRNAVNDIALQLLRNAVVHGIESGTERATFDKPETGSIHVSLKQVDDEFELILRDDGRGLQPKLIRTELLRRGHYSEQQLSEMSDKQIIQKIFEAGFSTAKEINRDAGQGVGMDVVKHKIKELGAHLQITTRENLFTQFSVRFSPELTLAGSVEGNV